MLLKARGWRGTSLPRGSENAWFSNPIRGFASSNYVADTKKLNPFRVHFIRPFNPHVGSLRSPTWGFQKHNSYRVALPPLACYLATWSLRWNNRVEITTRQDIERMLICVILRRKVAQVAWWFESKSRVIYVKWLCKQIWITRIGDKSLLLNSFNCLSRTKVFDAAICLKKCCDLSLTVRWFDVDCMEFQCYFSLYFVLIFAIFW